MVDRGRGVFHRTGEKVESMDDAIALANGWLVEIVVHKLNGVRKQYFFGDGIGYLKVAVVVECWNDVEDFAAAEFPRSSCGWFVVDYDWTPMGTMGVASKLKGPL